MLSLHFTVYCATHWGQNVFLIIQEKTVPMRYTNDYLWQCSVELTPTPEIQYSYFVEEENNPVIQDAILHRHFFLSTSCRIVELYDEFNFPDFDRVYLSKPFTDCFGKYSKNSEVVSVHPGNWLFKVHVPCLDDAYGVGLIGDHPQLGSFKQDAFLPMQAGSYPEWHLSVPIVKDTNIIHYKFIIYNKRTRDIVHWEKGSDRMFCFGRMDDTRVLSCLFRQNKLWRAAGVSVPVFALRSEHSCGIGDFEDLRLLIDWAALTGQKMIQILPINDTTNTHTKKDSYPYSTNSVHALHPLYLRLEAVGILSGVIQKHYEKRRQRLNSKIAIDYPAVDKLKWQYIHRIYALKGAEALESADYLHFFNKNRFWLISYSVYSCLREEFKTSETSAWGVYSHYNEEQVISYFQNNRRETGLYCFVQYHLYLQLSEIRDYAHRCGIALKGDLPIGISPHSVDAWVAPHLFHLDKQAGAPPDDFSERGQNWGFPTYNWSAMAQDGYSWWRQRFESMSTYFDAFRIDHILGFFRIWEIPKTALWGLLGYFNPAKPLNKEEIEAFGLKWQERKMLKPYISKQLLQELFGKRFPKEIWLFLKERADGTYSFKRQYSTQSQLKEAIDKLPAAIGRRLLDPLLKLQTEVLFIEDGYRSNLYHPRITIYKSAAYKRLSSKEQDAIDRLYHSYFFEMQETLWKEHALAILPNLLASTNMLVCGEDLGMVPACVPEVMLQLQILSLEIQRMPKESGQMFILPEKTPYLSVSSTGTHDMSSLRGWWQEAPSLTQYYYTELLKKSGTPPALCTPDIVEQILSMQMSGNSMWVILPLQDYLALEPNLCNPNADAERINIPDNPYHYWSYRIYATLEKLLMSDILNKKVLHIINKR